MKSAIGGDISITFGGQTYHINDCKMINVTQECDVISETSYDHPCTQHSYGKPTISGTFEAIIGDNLYLKIAEAIYNGLAIDLEFQILATTKFTEGFKTTIYFDGVYFESLPLLSANFQSGAGFESITFNFKANKYRISDGGIASDVFGDTISQGLSVVGNAFNTVNNIFNFARKFF